MKFYYLPNSYFGQIEAWALLGFRFGHTAFGLALWPPQGRTPWWAPHVRLEFGSHTGCCGQRWLFRARLFGRWLGCRTRGDATPDMLAYQNAGLHLR